MRRRHGKRAGLGGMLLAALAALALLALPSFAAAKDRNNDRIPDRWEKRHDLSLKVSQAALRSVGPQRTATCAQR